MTKADFMEKYTEMVDDARNALVKEGERLIATGAVDVGGSSNDYALPKVVFVVAMENVSTHYTILNDYFKKEAKNLRRF